ncbi:MAG: Na+/H+ antiporter subunit E [Gammaproteobacteria bacterium]|nr:Na+/H+ antiporter subunit E [Gammaproteobacteria bacterium]
MSRLPAAALAAMAIGATLYSSIPMTRSIVLFVVFALAWLLWSGLYKTLLLVLGVLSCGLVVVLARRMELTETGAVTLGLLPRIPRYWGWLFVEIVKSNIEVARVILDPRLRIQPQVVEIDAETRTDAGQAILGNSITLTPGSVTLDVYDGKLTVHCLTDAGAAALRAGEMNRRVRDVLGG